MKIKVDCGRIDIGGEGGGSAHHIRLNHSYSLAIGSMVCFEVSGIRVTIKGEELPICDDLRKAAKEESACIMSGGKVSPEYGFLCTKTDKEIEKLFKKILNNLSVGQMKGIFTFQRTQSFADGWYAKERQINQLNKEIQGSPPAYPK